MKWEFSTEVILLTAIVLVAVFHSTAFEVEYSKKLVNLYINPWWRLLVVALVVAAAIWSPRLGILVALAAFFYLSDVGALITPFVDQDK
jgi:hypothetical protein